MLRGGQCLGIQLNDGKRLKCPAAAPGGFDFTHYNRLVKAAGLSTVDPWVAQVSDDPDNPGGAHL